MKERRGFLLLSIMLVLALALSACTPDDDDVAVTPDEPTVVRVGVGSDVTNLDSRLATDVASSNVTSLVYAGLVEWDANLNITPYVAKEIDYVDDLTYRFTLHEGVLFHDGVELTAEDVKYTFDTLRDPDFGARNIAFYQPIDEIVILDPYTIEFRLEYPSAPIMYYMHVGIIPKHVADEHGDAYLQTNPVGAGPYVFEDWRPNDRVVLKAFDDFFMGRPGIDEIVFRPIPESVTRVVELETGGVHVVDSIPPEDVARLQAEAGITVEVLPGTGFDYFSFNHQAPPFNDVRVRQAIAYAIDREGIIDHVYRGLRQPAYSPILPQSWGHNPDVPRFEYNPEKALELLAAAGYEDGITVELKISDDDIRREISEIVQHDLAPYGIDIVILEQEWGAFYDDILSGEFEMYILGWSGQTDPDRGVYRQFHSKNWAPVGANRQLYANDRVDELLDLALTTSDQDQRKIYYDEIQEILAEEQSYVYLSYATITSAHRDELKNFGYCGYYYFRHLKDAYLDR